jgi:hypothetical protein
VAKPGMDPLAFTETFKCERAAASRGENANGTNSRKEFRTDVRIPTFLSRRTTRCGDELGRHPCAWRFRAGQLTTTRPGTTSACRKLDCGAGM